MVFSGRKHPPIRHGQWKKLPTWVRCRERLRSGIPDLVEQRHDRRIPQLRADHMAKFIKGGERKCGCPDDAGAESARPCADGIGEYPVRHIDNAGRSNMGDHDCNLGLAVDLRGLESHCSRCACRRPIASRDDGAATFSRRRKRPLIRVAPAGARACISRQRRSI